MLRSDYAGIPESHYIVLFDNPAVRVKGANPQAYDYAVILVSQLLEFVGAIRPQG